MITVDIGLDKDLKGVMEFKGLSTDTKPTENYEGIPIRNGSSFLEIDTQDVKFYNGATNTWI